MSGDYESNFDTESEAETQRLSDKRKDRTLAEEYPTNEWPTDKRLKTSKNVLVDETDKTERIIRNRFQALNAYSKHKLLVNEYILTHSGSTSKLIRNTSKDVTEYEVLRNNHQFIWDDVSDDELSWGQRLAKKYYNLLFKEYCISDLSRYKDNKFGMRWRTEREVLDGKGQFKCGGKHCDQIDGLKSWEVLFKYEELGEDKSALVKLRLCEDCSLKLNYRHKRREIKKLKKSHKKSKNNKTKTNDTDGDHQRVSPKVDNISIDNSASDGTTSGVNNIWAKTAIISDSEPKIDDEFDQYLDDLLV